MTQENVIRAARQEQPYDPDHEDTYARWLRSQEHDHGNLFPFSDNLATLMFIVASDLGEAQRERLTSSLSLKGINVAAYTFDTVRTVFVELFCTPRSSIENPSLRASGYGNDRNRSFLVGGEC